MTQWANAWSEFSKAVRRDPGLFFFAAIRLAIWAGLWAAVVAFGVEHWTVTTDLREIATFWGEVLVLAFLVSLVQEMARMAFVLSLALTFSEREHGRQPTVMGTGRTVLRNLGFVARLGLQSWVFRIGFLGLLGTSPEGAAAIKGYQESLFSAYPIGTRFARTMVPLYFDGLIVHVVRTQSGPYRAEHGAFRGYFVQDFKAFMNLGFTEVRYSGWVMMLNMAVLFVGMALGSLAIVVGSAILFGLMFAIVGTVRYVRIAALARTIRS